MATVHAPTFESRAAIRGGQARRAIVAILAAAALSALAAAPPAAARNDAVPVRFGNPSGDRQAASARCDRGHPARRFVSARRRLQPLRLLDRRLRGPPRRRGEVGEVTGLQGSRGRHRIAELRPGPGRERGEPQGGSARGMAPEGRERERAADRCRRLARRRRVTRVPEALGDERVALSALAPPQWRVHRQRGVLGDGADERSRPGEVPHRRGLGERTSLIHRPRRQRTAAEGALRRGERVLRRPGQRQRQRPVVGATRPECQCADGRVLRTESKRRIAAVLRRPGHIVAGELARQAERDHGGPAKRPRCPRAQLRQRRGHREDDLWASELPARLERQGRCVHLQPERRIRPLEHRVDDVDRDSDRRRCGRSGRPTFGRTHAATSSSTRASRRPP